MRQFSYAEHLQAALNPLQRTNAEHIFRQPELYISMFSKFRWYRSGPLNSISARLKQNSANPELLYLNSTSAYISMVQAWPELGSGKVHSRTRMLAYIAVYIAAYIAV